MTFVTERLSTGQFLVKSDIGLHAVSATSEDEAIAIVNKLVAEFFGRKIARFVEIDRDEVTGVILYEAIFADGSSEYYVSAGGRTTGPYSENKGRDIFLKQIKKLKPKGYVATPPTPKML